MKKEVHYAIAAGVVAAVAVAVAPAAAAPVKEILPISAL